MALKQSVSWWCFVREGFGATDLVTHAARIGYAACELVPEEHWALVRDAGLTIAAVSGHASLSDCLKIGRAHV